MELGRLSAKYESNGDSCAISNTEGDLGGRSYGCYQFAINSGIPQDFVRWLVDQGNDYGYRLSQYECGSEEFNDEWETIGESDNEGFYELQHQYVIKMYYEPAVERASEAGITLDKHSFALKNVVFSAAVQYGVYYIKELFEDACDILGYPNVSYIDDITFDKQLIEAIYTVRKSDEWTNGSPDLRYGLRNRFTNECNDALEMLANELS